MRPQASLILSGTLFASGLMFVLSGPGHTLDWHELGLIGGAAGALLSLRFYARWLAGHADTGGARPALPLFWKGIALLILFGFWFSAALALNTAWSWQMPMERIEGTVSSKRVAKGRYGDDHYAQIATSRGPVEAGMPRDVWSGVAEGQRFTLLVCRGLLGYLYVVTPLDRGPYLDIKRLLGLREGAGDFRC